MAEFKLVLSTQDGKSYQREVKDKEARPFLGKKIGNTLKGDEFGLAGYEVQITGGSDYCGFAMRKDVQGTVRKRILTVSGVGVKKKAKGIRQRKTVCGNTIHGKISQINLKVLKAGKESLAKAEEKPEADKKSEAEGKKPAKEEKPGKPKEEKQSEKKEKKPGKPPEKAEAKPETPGAQPSAEGKRPNVEESKDESAKQADEQKKEQRPEKSKDNTAQEASKKE